MCAGQQQNHEEAVRHVVAAWLECDVESHGAELSLRLGRESVDVVRQLIEEIRAGAALRSRLAQSEAA